MEVPEVDIIFQTAKGKYSLNAGRQQPAVSDDYRQCQAYKNQAVMRKEGLVPLGSEVGYTMRILLALKTLIAPRVKDLAVVERMEEKMAKVKPGLMIVAPKVEVGTPEAETWDKKLRLYRYIPAGFGVAPTKTLEVSLAEPEDNILAQMASRTRYNIRLSERKGVTIKVYSGQEELATPGLFDEFYTLYHENCKRVKIASETKENLKILLEAFEDDAILIHAFFENALCAVASLVVAGDSITYYVNGSTEVGRKNFAPNLVVWEGMKAGKQKGCLWFDFDGIFDDRYPGQKEWEGFTRFKKGFGGVERTYIGSFTKWFPLLKRRKTAKALLAEQAEVN
jgi:hypothetical protein